MTDEADDKLTQLKSLLRKQRDPKDDAVDSVVLSLTAALNAALDERDEARRIARDLLHRTGDPLELYPDWLVKP